MGKILLETKTKTRDVNTLMSGNVFNLGGNIRTFPRDFIVEEVWDNHVCDISYSFTSRMRDRLLTKLYRKKDYLHFTLVKSDWETIRSLNYIRRRLGVSLRRFGISGMKDKRAITAQRVSMWKGRVETVIGLNLKDMFLKDFEYADERINLGNAVGNRFTVTVRNIPKNKGEILKILRMFRDIVITRGTPNYYGPQRISGNVEVGKAIKEGDLKLGVELILKKVKKRFEEGGIENIPKVFWYEKRMLKHLAKYPNDYAGALRKIPKKIRTLYVHAYQSNLFNKKLKLATIENNVPENITIPGFNTPKMPELRTSPIKRRTYIKTDDFKILKVTDGEAIIRFTLAKGEYASTLLTNLNI